MTNILQRTNGGWAALRNISYNGIATVYGMPYHQISPIVSSGEWNDMIEWTVDTFGPTPKDGVWTPNARWYVNNAKFWFKEQKDLEWFLLKWQ